MNKLLFALVAVVFAPSMLSAQSNGDTVSMHNFSYSTAAPHSIHVGSDDGIWVPASQINGISVSKFQSDGRTLDAGFGTNGVASYTLSINTLEVLGTHLDANNRFLAVGRFQFTSPFGGTSYVQLAGRLLADGQADPALTFVVGTTPIQGFKNISINGFNQIGSAQTYMYDITTAASIGSMMNPVVIAGTYNTGTTTTPSSQQRGFVAALDSNLNSGWQYDISTSSRMYSAVVQSNGRVVAAGEKDGEAIVIRLTTTGGLDSNFNATGEHAFSQFTKFDLVRLQADGKAVLAARDGTNFSIIRLNVDGTLDSGFGTNGIANFPFGAVFGACYVSEMSFQPTTGKIAVGIINDEGRHAFLYLNTDGTPSNFFADGSLSGVRIFPNIAATTDNGITGVDFQSTGNLATFAVTNGNLGLLLRFALDVTTPIGVEQLQAAQNLHLFPNPVRSNATLTYHLPTTQRVSLYLVDISGRTVATLLTDTERAAGQQQEMLQIPSHLAAGQYFLLLDTGSQRSSLSIQVQP